MSEECPKEKSNAVAYDLIYKPPAAKSPLPASPKSDRPVSREIIEQKMREATERRENLLREQEESIAKARQRREEVVEKAHQQEEELKTKTAENLKQKLDEAAERREKRLQSLRQSTAEQLARVDLIRSKNEDYVEQLRLRIEQKLEQKNAKRDQILADIRDKLLQHENHVDETKNLMVKRVKYEADKNLENMMEKMNNAMKNREKQLNDLMGKLHDHDKKGEGIRQKVNAGGDAPNGNGVSPTS